MIGIKNFSIKKKLIAIQLLTAFIVLLFFGIFVVFNVQHVFRRSVITQLTSMAQLIGANSISALNSLDNEVAEEILSSLATEGNIVNAWIYDANGDLFAKYSKTGYANFSFPKIEKESHQFSGDYISVSKRIFQDGNIIGMVSLRLDMKQFRHMVKQNIIVAFFVMIAGMIIALLLSILMQRTISNPILHLVEATKEVSETGNYFIRVKKEGEDEIGVLYDSFNTMLEQIHKRQLERDKVEAALWESEEKLLRESEKKYRLLVENLPNVVFKGYKDWSIDFIDDKIELFTGYRKEDFNSRKMKWRDIVIEEDIESMQKALIEALKTDKSYIREYRIKTKTGDIQWVQEGSQIVCDEKGEIEFVTGAFINVTDRKRAEEKIKEYSENLEGMVGERTSELEAAQEAMLNLVEDLNNSKDELEEMNIEIQEATEAKSRFLANMSHELRTPLNAIIGFSEILEDQTFGKLNEKQTRYINNVLVSGRHLLQLINDILDLSKVEAGKLELELSRVNIKGLLENSLIMIKEKAMKLGVKLDLQISQELMDLEISADGRKLKQIMFNLLSNAAKFTPAGGSIRLEANLISDFGFRISELEKEGKIISDQSAIKISVADTGIGIKPEDQERVFGEFEQLDSTYARQQEGTGLGLALTRRLVELHGGRIWAESEGDGKGSTFTFVIPTKAEERKGEVPTEPEEPLPSRPDLDDSRPLVLVVEDERQASELISHYLSEAGYAVAHAFDGEQAIQMALELRPYAITLDIILPKKNGWEVLAELKGLPETKDIPVIIVSITENHQLGINLGTIEYFVKPVKKERLIEAVRKAGAVLGKEKITALVVDDEPQTVELLTDKLQAEGFNVLQAYGGQQGIDLAIEKHPDVIILDLIMPEVSGFDVVQQLRAHSVAMKIPIMIFTAKDLTEEDRQRLEGHVKMIASKSGSGKEDLLRELERLVKRKPNR